MKQQKKLLKERGYKMITFEEKTHTYRNDGVAIPSVSEILGAVLGSHYEDIPEIILEIAAKKGTLVHEEVQGYEALGLEGFTDELEQYKILKEKYNINVKKMEEIVFSENNIVPFAGRYDMLLKGNIIADIKTTYNLDIERTTWQLSLYAYALGLKSKKGFIVWLRPEKAEFKEVELYSKEEVEDLLLKFKNGETIKKEVVELKSLDLTASKQLKKYLEEIKKAEENIKVFKDALLEEMGSRGVKSFDNGEVVISYVEETERKTIDSKKLKEEYPEVAEKCEKVSKVKPSIRIKLK